MQSMAPYQRRIILILIMIILTGLAFKLIDRQRQAVGFDIKGFLDGYKYTKTFDTSDVKVEASTPVVELENSTVEAEMSIININEADSERLQILPGIGPVLAQNIISFRDSAGHFNCADDLLKVKGIGRKKLSKITERIEF